MSSALTTAEEIEQQYARCISKFTEKMDAFNQDLAAFAEELHEIRTKHGVMPKDVCLVDVAPAMDAIYRTISAISGQNPLLSSVDSE